MESLFILFLIKDFCIISTKILFVLKHSEPPRSKTEFPDLRHKEAASEVTFGLDSYIMQITPNGIDCLNTFNPFGLSYKNLFFLTGSSRSITSFIFCIIWSILSSLSFNLS